MNGGTGAGGARPADARGSSLGGLARTVAWGLFGVRKASAHQSDLGHVNPLHIVVAALVGLALLVGLLIGMAHWMARIS